MAEMNAYDWESVAIVTWTDRTGRLRIEVYPDDNQTGTARVMMLKDAGITAALYHREIRETIDRRLI